MPSTNATREAYEKKIDAKLDEWRAEIDKLKAKSAQAAADTRIEYQRRLEDAESRYDDLRRGFQQLRQAADDGWERTKGAVDAAQRELGDTLEQLGKKLK